MTNESGSSGTGRARAVAVTLCLTLMSAMAAGAAGSMTQGDKAAADWYIELIRSDIKEKKTALLTEALSLSEIEARGFWPIYREYEVELTAWGDKRTALIRRYADAYNAGGVTDVLATDLASRWLKLAEDRIGLWSKYYKKIAKAVSPMRAAQFLQAEHQLNLLTDVYVATEVPFIQPSR